MNIELFLKVIDTLRKNLPNNSPATLLKNSYKRNPYTILMVTLLSLRSKDQKTATIANKLFNEMEIKTPQELLNLSQKELEEIIKPLGFYRQKAKTLIEVSKILIEKYNSKVPRDKDKLLQIKGIGEKSANVVLNSAFNEDIIAVDTHLHRLTNMWKIVDTKSFDETSKILNKIVPKNYKKDLNHILVSFGQTICTPQKPKCDICPIFKECEILKNNS